MKNDSQPLMVSIRCLVYNHERYIRQCLEGFVMQRTNFRFEAIVHDDASTDGTVDIIREYAEKYPDIIKPIFEIENQYSKHDGSLRRIMDGKLLGKYVAICEGDDYWTDPLKLQKQFDFMESHPECSLCFHAHNDLYPDGKLIKIYPREIKEKYGAEDIVLIEDNIIGTNTIFCRWHYLRQEGCPTFWSTCPVGDLPLRLYFVSKGLIGYINEEMSVYRRNAQGGWTTQKRSLVSITKHRFKIINMYKLYDEYTQNNFHVLIKKQVNKLKINTLRAWVLYYPYKIVGCLRNFCR